MAYTKACPSLELQTLPRFRPVSLSLSVDTNNGRVFFNRYKTHLPMTSWFFQKLDHIWDSIRGAVNTPIYQSSKGFFVKLGPLGDPLGQDSVLIAVPYQAWYWLKVINIAFYTIVKCFVELLSYPLKYIFQKSTIKVYLFLSFIVTFVTEWPNYGLSEVNVILLTYN
jgi:hypothetical protein